MREAEMWSQIQGVGKMSHIMYDSYLRYYDTA